MRLKFTLQDYNKKNLNLSLSALSARFTGFTLIELLVVVLIIGILAAIALPQYQKAVAKTRMAEGLTVLKSLRVSLETYYMMHGDYPPMISGGLSELSANLDISFQQNSSTSVSGGQIFNSQYYKSIYINVKIGGGETVSLAQMLTHTPQGVFQKLSNKTGCMPPHNPSKFQKQTCRSLCGHQTVGRVFFYDAYGCLINDPDPASYPRGTTTSWDE